MMFRLPVVSSSNPLLPVTLVEVDAPNFRRAKRAALFIARKMGMVKPRPLGEVQSDHEAAVRFREQMLAVHGTPMPNVDGPRDAWWQRRDRTPLYDER